MQKQCFFDKLAEKDGFCQCFLHFFRKYLCNYKKIYYICNEFVLNAEFDRLNV